MSLRDKYANKATPTSTMRKAKEADDEIAGKGGKNDYIKLKDGVNKIRFFMVHDGEESFKKLRSSHWVTVTKDGEEQRRCIPNSRVHGGTPKDICEEFCKLVRAKYADGDADALAKIKALNNRDAGIDIKSTWISWAKKIAGEDCERGLIEMKKTVRDALDDNAIIEDADEAIETEPYTDLETGIPVLITYNSKAKKAADYYKVQLSKKASPLTDEDLEWFDKQTPLSQLSQFKYGRREFEMGLEGVQNFDEQFEIGIFETPEFQELVEEISAYYTREEDEAEEEDKPAKKSAAPAKKKTAAPAAAPAKKAAAPKKAVVEEEEEVAEPEEEAEEEAAEEETTDIFADMDRTALKQYKAENAIDTFKVVASMEDETIRENLRAWLATQEEPAEEEEEEAQAFEEEEEEAAPVKPAAKKPSPTLDGIKKKLGTGKK